MIVASCENKAASTDSQINGIRSVDKPVSDHQNAILECISMWSGVKLIDLEKIVSREEKICYAEYCARLFACDMLPLPNLYDYFMRADASGDVDLASDIYAKYANDIYYLIMHTQNDYKYNMISRHKFWERTAEKIFRINSK